jgi:predicted AAA+ superfamily ATPase
LRRRRVGYALTLDMQVVSADDPNLVSAEWLRNEWHLARALAKNGEALIVIDEIQKVSKWISSSGKAIS